VRWRDGLAGAAVAAIVIEILKSGFSIYIGTMSSYQTVYGAIAAIPIFLLWMYVSWMAVLLGAVVAANLATWRIDERLAHLSTGGVRLGFSLALIAALARAQRRGIALPHRRNWRPSWSRDLGCRRTPAAIDAGRLCRADPSRRLGPSPGTRRPRRCTTFTRRSDPAARRSMAGSPGGALAGPGIAGDGTDRQSGGRCDARHPGELLADVRAPAARPLRAIADRFGAE